MHGLLDAWSEGSGFAGCLSALSKRGKEVGGG